MNWPTVLLSIPISILAGLCVAPIQRLLQSWAGQAARVKRAERIDRRTREFVDHPEKYNEYLISVVLRLVILLGVIVTGWGQAGLSLGTVAFPKVGNVPLSNQGQIFFLLAAMFGLIASTLSIAAFTAQVVSNLRWWLRVEKMRNSKEK